MGTVPTGLMERELHKLYLRWLAGLSSQTNVSGYIDVFQKASTALISRYGGHAASLGALAGFPVPKRLDLSPHVGVVYDDMKQAAISASITAGINAKEAARAMLHAGMDKSYRRLERLARTETVSAYWKNQWDSVAELPLIVMLWGSESGPRTCDYCLSRDGLVVDAMEIRDHPNGRCTLVPTLRSLVKYKGTLQPDGSVDMDPRWADQKVKGYFAQDSAGYTTEEQRDPLSGRSNPAALSVANAAQAAAPVVNSDPFNAKFGQITTPSKGSAQRYLIKEVNPGIDFVDTNYRPLPQYVENCTRVSSAHELRVRGYDAVANGNLMQRGQAVTVQDVAAMWKDASGVSREFTSVKNATEAVNLMKSSPAGSRFLISNQWADGGGGHIWNAEITTVNGKPVVNMIDAQKINQYGDPSRYLKSSTDINILRIDDLMPSSNLIDDKWVVTREELTAANDAVYAAARQIEIDNMLVLNRKAAGL